MTILTNTKLPRGLPQNNPHQNKSPMWVALQSFSYNHRHNEPIILHLAHVRVPRLHGIAAQRFD